MTMGRCACASMGQVCFAYSMPLSETYGFGVFGVELKMLHYMCVENNMAL